MKRHKKSKLLTYFLSFIPGIGFMYRGYMKRGFSYLTVFACMVSILDWLGITLLNVIAILFWVYSFFDQINSFSGTDEELLAMKDEKIWNSYIDNLNMKTIGQNHRMVGGALVVIGGYLLMKGIYCALITFLPNWLRYRLMYMLEYAPQILLGIIILYCGTRCLRNTEILSKFLEKLVALLPHKRPEQMLSKPNVVYYMEKGEKMVEKSEREILEAASREQLLRKAKEMLDDDIYTSIQIETASTHEKAPEIEPVSTYEKAPQIDAASAIEKAPNIESVVVEKCPDLF